MLVEEVVTEKFEGFGFVDGLEHAFDDGEGEVGGEAEAGH